MERAEKAKSPEMETAGPPPNDMKRFYVNGRHLLREIAGLYVLIPAGETDAPQNRITALNETGRFLWMQFQHPCTVAEASAAAEAQYTGIENFVRAGLRAGLLREASAAEKTEGKAVYNEKSMECSNAANGGV